MQIRKLPAHGFELVLRKYPRLLAVGPVLQLQELANLVETESKALGFTNRTRATSSSP